MKIDYSGKSIIVTGAGGGIGRVSAPLFAKLGGQVIAADIDESSVRETAEIIEKAGGSFPTPMGDIDRDEFNRIRALNFDAVYHASMRALPIMAENGGGVIISTTSSAGTGAVNGLAVYGAAKAGVNSLMRSIALEYGKQGIRANAIAPSTGSPGMIQWLETLPGGVKAFSDAQPMGRLGRPDEIADVAAYLAYQARKDRASSNQLYDCS